jgi:hypothetical protein
VERRSISRFLAATGRRQIAATCVSWRAGAMGFGFAEPDPVLWAYSEIVARGPYSIFVDICGSHGK